MLSNLEIIGFKKLRGCQTGRGRILRNNYIASKNKMDMANLRSRRML